MIPRGIILCNTSPAAGRKRHCSCRVAVGNTKTIHSKQLALRLRRRLLGAVGLLVKALALVLLGLPLAHLASRSALAVGLLVAGWAVLLVLLQPVTACYSG